MSSKWRKLKLALGFNLCVYVPPGATQDSPEKSLLSPTNWSFGSARLSKSLSTSSKSLQGESYSTGLVQTLHDASRLFELAIKQKSSESKTSWFSTAWFGVDRNSWLKALSYQTCHWSRY